MSALMFVLTRKMSDTKQTLGELVIDTATARAHTTQPTFKTLELPWKDNKRGVSCIPKGTYRLKIEENKTFGTIFRVYDVPGRDGVLIHPGNFNTQIRGCILVGDKYSDINGDGELDVLNTRTTIKKLIAAAKGQMYVSLKIQ